MAKSRRNRGKASLRRDPISKPVKPPSDPELAALREAKVLPIIKDLQSPEPNARAAAAAAISSIVQDERCRKLLLREQIVHTVLSQTLTDSALESRAAGWGILQVLAQEEEADFCIHLFRLDVLTAVEYASKAVSEKLFAKDSKLPKAEQTIFVSIACSLVALTTVLAEAQDDILVTISTNAAITHFLATIVSTELPDAEQGADLRRDAMACLMTLCEDNEHLSTRILSSQDQGCLEALTSFRTSVDGNGVLACGLLHNAFASINQASPGSEKPMGDDSILIPTLSKVISAITFDPVTAEGSGWSDPIEYRQLALEILASIGTDLSSAAAESAQQEASASADDDDDDKDDEDMGDAAEDDEGAAGEDQDDAEGGDDDEMDDDAMEADMDMVTGGGDQDGSDNIDDLPVLKALLQTTMPELLRIAQLQPTDEPTMRLQGLALSALNNVSWSIAIVDFDEEQNQGIRKAWEPLGRSIWTSVIAPILASDTADIGLATQVTSLAWAVARSLRAGGGDVPLAADEHRKFISLYQATRGAASPDGGDEADDPFQSIGVKCIGVLGQLAMDPAPVSRNREVGAFLVTVLAGLPQTPAADAVEALNQVFDVYGDETAACDKEVFWKDNFLKHLDEVVPKARAMVKSVDKGKQAELRLRADEAVLNLNRFISYKRKHKP